METLIIKVTKNVRFFYDRTKITSTKNQGGCLINGLADFVDINGITHWRHGMKFDHHRIVKS